MTKSSKAYDLAWKVLDERYGNPHLIASSFIQKLRAWPKVKSGYELRDFSDFLGSCNTAMEQLPTLKALDNILELKEIAGKLPDHMRHRWRREATSKTETGQAPAFDDLVRFISWEAKVACNPAFISQSDGDASIGRIPTLGVPNVFGSRSRVPLHTA